MRKMMMMVWLRRSFWAYEKNNKSIEFIMMMTVSVRDRW